MVRVTVAGLQQEIRILLDQAVIASENLDTAKRSSIKLGSELSQKTAEINTLKKHIGFVHAQRDRLVGFIQGRESITKPEIDELNTTTYPPSVQKIDRVERFLDECTLQFINEDGPTVANDPFRRSY